MQITRHKSSIAVQNVVAYSVLIDAPNPDLTLEPGMTANVTIEVARREGVLRVPAAALRFRPAGQGGRESQVWRAVQGELTPVPVVAGLSDGQFTAVDGELSEGEMVVTRQATVDQPVRPAASASPFQFMQPPGRPRAGG